ncbi:MAG TPA: EamA family transporter [Acidimicrobiales bacterium]|nr:EamA family transporter [Acidimicrobiales bacterium]
MRDSLLVATFAGLGGMLGWGVADFFAKKTVDAVGEIATLFWAQIVGLVPLLGLLAVVREVPTVHCVDALWLVLFGIVNSVSYLWLYAGFRQGTLSVLSPIFSSHAVLVVLLSAVVFGEHVSKGQCVAIAVVICGVVAISTTFGDVSTMLVGRRVGAMPGLRLVAASAVADAFWFVLFDRFLGPRDWLFFLVLIRVTAAFTVGVYAIVTGEALTVPSLRVAPYIGLIGVCDAAAFAAVSYGFSATTHTAIIVVLSSAFSVPTLVLARVFLRERMATHQKIAASMIICGIALVSIR